MNNTLVKILDELDGKNPKALAELRGFIDTTIAKKRCAECEQLTNPDTYKKQIDRDEYFISGICEKCQPLYFGGKKNGH